MDQTKSEEAINLEKTVVSSDVVPWQMFEHLGKSQVILGF